MPTFEIKPDDIDALVKDAVLQAVAGKTISEHVNKVLSGYNSPIDDSIRKVVTTVTMEVLGAFYKDAIRDAVVRALADKLTTETIERAANAAASELIINARIK